MSFQHVLHVHLARMDSTAEGVVDHDDQWPVFGLSLHAVVVSIISVTIRMLGLLYSDPPQMPDAKGIDSHSPFSHEEMGRKC